jgi:hypothetical protein
MSSDKQGYYTQEIRAAPTKIAEFDTVSLGDGLFGSGGSIYNKDTIQNILSSWTQNDKSRNRTQGGLKFLATSIQDSFQKT